MADKLTSPLGVFKEREIEILELMAQGDSNIEIAEKLFISKTTVRWYNKNIYSKLGTSRRTEAIALAREMGLIEDSGTASLAALSPSLQKHNLPTIATPFLGRDQEITDLKDRLTTSNTPLITVLASGGMGKTRLAIELGHQLVDSFSDGVYLFELAPLSKANDIVKTALSTLGISDSNGDEPEKALFNACRGKKMLFIFDNFEELLDGASFISSLIQNLPDARTLVTSRERLNLHGEMVFHLRGLTESGVALFKATAKAMQAHFELGESEESAVQEIVNFVGGMPLAIIMAASWTESLSVREIAEEVQSSLDLLETEMRDIPQRQQSIRGVLMASWQKLSQKEQAVCMKLAIFKGGFSRGAATQIAQASLPILRKLQHRSFVQKVSDRRYDLHPLIRQFGLEQLETNRLLNETHEQHLAYFQQHIEETLEGLDHGDFVYPLDQVQLEHDNVRLALDWGIRQDEANIGSLTLTMARFWENRTYPQEAIHYLSQALILASDKRQRVQVSLWRCLFFLILSRNEEAEADSRIALAEAELLEDVELQLDALSRLTRALIQQETLEVTIAERYITLSKRARNRKHLANAFSRLADLHRKLGQEEEAIVAIQQALQLARELEDDGRIAAIAYNLGLTFISQNRLPEAQLLIEESLALKRLMGERAGTISRLCMLSDLAIYEERFQDAEAYIEEGFATIELIGREAPRRKVELLTQKGYWYQAQSKWNEALQYLKEALTLARQINHRFLLVNIQVFLAFVYVKSGAPNQARHFLQQALSLAHKYHLLIFYEDLLFTTAIYYEAQANFNKLAEVYLLLIEVKPQSVFYQKDIEVLKQSLQAHISPAEWEEIRNGPHEQEREAVLSRLIEALSNE